MNDPLHNHVDKLDLSHVAISTLLANAGARKDATSAIPDVRDTNYGTVAPPSRGRSPAHLSVGSKRRAWNKMYRLLKDLETRMALIEDPIKKSISSADLAAKSLNDPDLSKKVRVKFSRIFGTILSTLEMSRSYLDPLMSRVEEINKKIRSETSKIQEYKSDLEDELRAETKGARDTVEISKIERQLSELEKREAGISASEAEAKDVFDGVTSVAKAVGAGLKSIDPGSYVGSLRAEIKKQSVSIVNMEKTIAGLKKSHDGKSATATLERFGAVVQAAKAYVAGLSVIASPDFADRVENNIRRATDEGIPGLLDAMHDLGLAYGATHEKKGEALAKLVTVASRFSSRGTVQSIFSKKIHRIAKRDAVLRYLSTTS